MMRQLVAGSLRFRFLVVAAAAAMLAIGVGRVYSMPVDVFPEFAPPRVEVQTPCLGLSASETEEFVTVPLEQTLNGIPGLDVVRSKSVSQLSWIELQFKRGTNLLDAREIVQERLTAASPHLPTWAAPPVMIPPVSATSRIMKIGVTSDEISLTHLSTIAYWTIRQRLLRVPGVANVAIWGERIEQEHVLVDPQRMQAQQVSLQRVMETTADALDAGLLKYSDGAVIGRGGFVETPNNRLVVRHILPIVTPKDLAEIPLEGENGTLRLGDVAQVQEGYPPLFGEAVIDGGPGLLLIVEKFPGANTLRVTHGVEQAIDDLKPGLPGVEFNTQIFRPASFIESAISNLERALIIGCLLVLLILIAFLFEWRAAFISLISIPLSTLAAVLLLDWRGETINTMILAGLVIAVGVVVDDAIIDVENIWRRARQRPAGKSTFRVVLDASLEVRRPIVYATLINVVAVVPVFFIGGLSGAFFTPLAVSYALAVLASMLVALTVTPALALILLAREPRRSHDAALVRWLKAGYGAVLTRVLARPAPVFVALGLLVVTGVVVVPRLGESLFPEFKERNFLMHYITKPGTSVTEEKRIVMRGSRQINDIPGVDHVGTHIGTALLGDEVVGVNFGEHWIAVNPKANYDQTLEHIEAFADTSPGLTATVETYLRERVEEVLSGASGAVVVRIFGPDLRKLRREAASIGERMDEVQGLDEVEVEPQDDIPQIDLEVNLAAARRYGITPGEVRRQEATLVSSEEVGDIFRGGKAYDVHVWSAPRTRASLSDLRKLPIDTPRGQVALSELARVAIGPEPNIIRREGASRRIDITANVEGPLGSAVDQVQDVLDETKFPVGYHAEILGESAERAAVEHKLLGYGGLAIVVVFFLLLAAFGAWRPAALLIVTLPVALVGGALAAWFAGGIISIGSLVGFLTVLGIAARNGILLINHCQHLEREEREAFGPALVLRGAQERLSPILMTALATGLAIMPLVVRGEIPGQEIEHPMAVVILGGLFTSTLVNLFLVPPLYLRFGKPGPAPSAVPAHAVRRRAR